MEGIGETHHSSITFSDHWQVPWVNRTHPGIHMNPILALGTKPKGFPHQLHPDHGNISPLQELPPPAGQQSASQQFFSGTAQRTRIPGVNLVFRPRRHQTDAIPLHRHPSTTCIWAKRSVDNTPVWGTPRDPQMLFVQTLTGQSSFDRTRMTCLILTGLS